MTHSSYQTDSKRAQAKTGDSANLSAPAAAFDGAALGQSEEAQLLIDRQLMHRQVIDRQLYLGPTRQADPTMLPGGTATAIQSEVGGGQQLGGTEKVQMEAAFGADFSDVRIHHDGSADHLARSVNAAAFTTGKDIFFRSGQYSPGASASSRLLAHELAHVVQQDGTSDRAMSGLSAPTGAREVAADKASQVAMDRLDGRQTRQTPVEASLEGGGDRHAVERRVWVGSARSARDSAGGTLLVPSGLSGEPLTNLLSGSDGQQPMMAAWETQIRPAVCAVLGVDLTALDASVEQRILAKLTQWCQQPTGRENVSAGVTSENAPAASSEERRYLNVEHLATALVHESDPRYAERLAVETELARAVATNTQYTSAFDRMLQAYGATLQPQQVEELSMLAANSRYRQFSQLSNAGAIFASPSGTDMGSKCILADEITKYAGSTLPASYADLRRSVFTEHGRYRENGYTVSEDHQWVREARALGVPLSAGPSDTTAKILGMARSVGLGDGDLFKIAWCMFSFYNGMWRGYSATHRL
ncbi:MAG: DUF4157 domain-containing protein, partial [Myxococcales bacterium]|nr:DUF4157 domain-containing protein [Myxococcales bacterium]